MFSADSVASGVELGSPMMILGSDISLAIMCQSSIPK